jgi:FAD/FMN-containing dehydrogenase
VSKQKSVVSKEARLGEEKSTVSKGAPQANIATRRLADSQTHPLAHSQPRSLEAELRSRLRGDVRFDAGSRALYATDASNYRQTPIGVILPKDKEDVEAAVAVCRRHDAPILARGGGTSLAGQCCNVAVVMDMSKYMNRVLDIDPERRLARVQPGVILDKLRAETRPFGLTFGPDPATHTHCTLGGIIGNNSCGVHSVMSGRAVDNVEALEVLTYDGLRLHVGRTGEAELSEIIAGGGRRAEIYRRLQQLRNEYAGLIRERFPDIPRLVSGYPLDQLLPENGFHVARALTGTECTCVTILEATVRLVPEPAETALLVLGYPDVFSAGDHLPELMRFKPTGLEGIDDRLVGFMQKKELHPGDLDLLPEGNGWLLVEFGGDSREEAQAQARRAMEALEEQDEPPSMRLYPHHEQEERIWAIRESGLGATANVPGFDDTWPGWEDAAVPPDRVGDYLRDFRHLLDEYGYDCALYGHFGQGCIHCRINFDLLTQDGIDHYLAFIDEAAELVIRYGGSLSGEHGDGQARAILLPKMFGEELVDAFREFKAIWDPEGKMNPGKVVHPFRPDENLRLGTAYNPWQPDTYFAYPEDGGSLAKATLRCVGVGKCRREESGVMCPSYMVTREEMHSTRGRAHLLFEMLQGEIIQDGWRDEHVKESLHLCLACKGCKGECPVAVDVGTYKAEFLAHYYEGRLRPLSAYAFAYIQHWARLAALAPGLANFFSQTAGLRDLGKWLLGVAPERQLPAFAAQTFKSWFQKRRRPYTRRRPRAQLHGRLPRRIDQFLSARQGRQTAARANLYPGRISNAKGAGFPAAAPTSPRRGARPLPSPGRHAHECG